MDIKQALKSAALKLSAKNIPDPRLEAEILLSEILKKPREFLLAHGENKLSLSQAANFKVLVAKHLKGEPIAYLTGHKEFYGLDFEVNKYVLIPRPETELMIEEALRLTAHNSQPTTLVDAGTGSGCIIISLAKQIADGKFIAIDISPKALSVARRNAKLNGVAKKIKFLRGNLLQPFMKNYKFLLLTSNLIILANLPYLTPAQIKNSPSIKYEPKIALNGGADGLDLYRKLAEQIKQLPGTKITLLCEIAHPQVKTMKKIFSFAKKLQIKKDLCGLNRFAVISING